MVPNWLDPTDQNLGIPLSSKSLVTNRICRAQCAILNPNTDTNFFLDATPDELDAGHLPFFFHSVCLEISGEKVDDLSFVGLPGEEYG